MGIWGGAAKDVETGEMQFQRRTGRLTTGETGAKGRDGAADFQHTHALSYPVEDLGQPRHEPLPEDRMGQFPIHGGTAAPQYGFRTLGNRGRTTLRRLAAANSLCPRLSRSIPSPERPLTPQDRSGR